VGRFCTRGARANPRRRSPAAQTPTRSAVSVGDRSLRISEAQRPPSSRNWKSISADTSENGMGRQSDRWRRRLREQNRGDRGPAAGGDGSAQRPWLHLINIVAGHQARPAADDFRNPERRLPAIEASGLNPGRGAERLGPRDKVVRPPGALHSFPMSTIQVRSRPQTCANRAPHELNFLGKASSVRNTRCDPICCRLFRMLNFRQATLGSGSTRMIMPAARILDFSENPP